MADVFDSTGTGWIFDASSDSSAASTDQLLHTKPTSGEPARAPASDAWGVSRARSESGSASNPDASSSNSDTFSRGGIYAESRDVRNYLRQVGLGLDDPQVRQTLLYFENADPKVAEGALHELNVSVKSIARDCYIWAQKYVRKAWRCVRGQALDRETAHRKEAALRVYFLARGQNPYPNEFSRTDTAGDASA